MAFDEGTQTHGREPGKLAVHELCVTRLAHEPAVAFVNFADEPAFAGDPQIAAGVIGTPPVKNANHAPLPGFVVVNWVHALPVQ